MALAMVRTYGSTGIPIWQGTAKDIQLLQGGCALVVTGFTAGMILPAGTPGKYDEAARTFTIAGQGAVLQLAATGNPLTYNINKNSGFRVGDYAALTVGGAAYAITGINYTNGAYDVITVGTTLGNAAVGAGVFISTATGPTAAAYDTAINGLLYDDTLANAGETASVVIRGTVYVRRIGGNAAGLAALAGLKFIIFSQSK